VTPHQDLAWEEVGVEGMDLGDVRERIVADSRRPFDLSTGPLFRVSLYTRAEDDRILLLTVHHSVFDARSMAVAFDESITMYPAFRRGRAPRLPPATSYSDFARRQADFVDSPDGERLARYWLDRLAGELPILELPTDRPRPSVQTLRGGTVEVQLPPSLTSAVMEVAHAERVTPFVIYLSALQVVLQRYSGQSEILIGTPTWGRTRPEFQRGIGYYVNPVVLRGDLSGSPTFRTLLGRTRTTVLEALAHQDYPFNLLVQRLGLAADRSRPPVFQVMFNYLNVAPLMVGRGLAGDGSATIEIAGLKIEGFPIPTQEGQFDLALEIVQAGPLTTAVLRYDSDLFDRETIERMAGHYRTLLEAAVQDPSTPISRLPLVTAEERPRILVDWNRTERSYPADATLPWLFETQAERTPDAIAVVCGDEALTYGELDHRANRLAHRLRSHGIGRESIVAIFMERSIEQVIAMLAVTKAGGAWVPIDPDYPPDRVRFMLEDSRAPVVLVHAATVGSLPATAAKLVRIDIDAATGGERFGAASDPLFDSPPPREIAPDDLAYVVYTSGSTGRPKGVMNTHRGICNRLLAQNDDLGVAPGDVCLHASPFGFDVSVTRTFCPLVAGAALVLAPQGAERDVHAVIDLIERHAVTVFPLVPSMLRALVETGELGRCRSLRCVTVGGEALAPELMRAFFEQLPCELYNMYGPTETAVTATSWRCDPAWAGTGPVPIGRPLANTTAYILDAHLEPVPIGVPGELCIGGVQVGRGYLNQPELTAERFVPDPFSDRPGARLYRTGDRARWLPDGTIEFLGRIDQQVKVRGYRIEPGEIESVFASQSGVSAAVVLPVTADGTLATSGVAEALIAFVVPRSREEGLQTDELRRALQAQLPRFMLPARIVTVDHIPLTPNGKADPRALLKLDPRPAAAPQRSHPPQTETEKLIAAIWQELLNVDHVDPDDNFYDLGGHSMLALQVVSRIEKAIGVRINPRELNFQTVRQLAATCDARRATAAGAQPNLVARVLRRLALLRR